MRKIGVTVAILAWLAAPMAAQASDIAFPNPKLPEATSTLPLLPKSLVPEARMGYGCLIGQAGGVAVSLLLGSGRAWDALTDAILGNPPSAEQRAACALGEALAPHLAGAVESLAQEAWAATQRHAKAAQEMMAAGSAPIEQGWVGLREETAGLWSRLWPMR
ncbi:MAG: hypothetical protein FJX33_00200 [Alphaproteobacteria bacterium]|nr:hypothetical protein [Alphaproteobacteria bacterium]